VTAGAPGGGERRALGSGAMLASAAQVATALALGLTSVFVARLLGPDGTGAYGVVSSGLVLLITMGSLGLGVGITYSVSHGRWPAGDALRQSQLVALALGLVVSAVGFGLAVLLDDSVLEEVPLGTAAIAVAAVPFALSWTYSWSVALGADRYEWYAVAYAGQAVLVLVLVAALGGAFGLEGAIAGLAAAYAIAAVAQLVVGARLLPAGEHLLRSAAARIRGAASFGLRAYMSNSVTYLALRADLFILSAYASAASVGHYAIALALTELVLLLPRSLAAVALPRVAALDASAEAEYQRLVMVKSIRHSVLVAVAAGLLLAAVTPLIPVIYGSDFSETIGLTLLLIPGAAALGAAAAFSSATTGKGKPEYSLYASMIVTVPSVALYLIVIPEHGATGAAIASSVSYFALAVAALLFFRRATGVRDLRGLLPRRDDLADYGTAIAGLRAARRGSGG
jgi:O-antigen/teichoic acid export membrane protein